MVDIYNFINELTKFEISYKDEKNIPHNYRSYIKSIEEDKILVAPPTYHKRAVTIKDGQKVKIFICTESGVYTAESIVVGRELGHTPGVWLTYPYNAKHSQRREYLRAPIDIEFDLVITPSNKNEKDITDTYTVKNISGKGLSFVSDKPLTNYYDLEVVLKLKEKGKKINIKTKCEHIYSNQYEVNGHTKYVHALAFTEISKTDSEKIVQMCFKYQLEQRKKEKLS